MRGLWTSIILLARRALTGMLALGALSLQSCNRPAPTPSGAPCTPLLGACVEAGVAAAACGPARRADGAGGCVFLAPCPRGSARALDTGECASPPFVRRAAYESGVRLGDDEMPRCDDGVLAVGAPMGTAILACIPHVSSAAASCPVGRIVDGHGSCAPVRDGRGNVDLVAWTSALATSLCVGASGSPLALLPAGTEARIRVRAPDNDLSLSIVEAEGPLEAAWLRLAAPRLEALRILGGTASVAVAEAVVRCAPAARPPRTEPLVDERRTRGDP